MQKLLTVKEVAEYLRLRRQTVVRKAEKGEIPAIKVCRRWRFPQDELEEWLRRGGMVPAGDKRISLKTYHMGEIIGTLSRREIYQDL
jgi:excisionase family DNA binding protein